jgi:hypothetical protein
LPRQPCRPPVRATELPCGSGRPQAPSCHASLPSHPLVLVPWA